MLETDCALDSNTVLYTFRIRQLCGEKVFHLKLLAHTVRVGPKGGVERLHCHRARLAHKNTVMEDVELAQHNFHAFHCWLGKLQHDLQHHVKWPAVRSRGKLTPETVVHKNISTERSE